METLLRKAFPDAARSLDRAVRSSAVDGRITDNATLPPGRARRSGSGKVAAWIASSPADAPPGAPVTLLLLGTKPLPELRIRAEHGRPKTARALRREAPARIAGPVSAESASIAIGPHFSFLASNGGKPVMLYQPGFKAPSRADQETSVLRILQVTPADADSSA